METSALYNTMYQATCPDIGIVHLSGYIPPPSSLQASFGAFPYSCLIAHTEEDDEDNPIVIGLPSCTAIRVQF